MSSFDVDHTYTELDIVAYEMPEIGRPAYHATHLIFL
jgi:hypothetical protein